MADDVFLFETSWEVCNKVGGIYTVIRTKAPFAVQNFGENYYLLGPDLKANPEFEETDEECWVKIREATAIKEIPCRFGRWKIPGEPKVILISFGKKFNKDQLLYELWEDYGVDSISGGWDYVEPVMFSYTCGAVIETVYNVVVRPTGGSAVAQFHEWMCGAGLLCIKKRVPDVGTIFTTHATILGRSLSGAGVDIYAKMEQISPQKEAAAQNIMAKYSMETATAREADCFTTVSQITDVEAKNFLGRSSDVILTNGLDMENVPNYSVNRKVPLKYRERLVEFASRFLRKKLDAGARLMLISGRYEFHNKGIDVFLQALGRLDKDIRGKDMAEVVALICVLGGHMAINPSALQAGPLEGGVPLISTHRLQNEQGDPILNACNNLGLKNLPENRVNIIFVPAFLNGHDGLINMDYYEVLSACDLGVFPSYYEPWGYTPHESVAYSVPTITTDQAGFGLWVQNAVGQNGGVLILNRRGVPFNVIVDNLRGMLAESISWKEEDYAERRQEARKVALQAGWSNFYDRYLEAYSRASTTARARTSSRATADLRAKEGHVFAGTASTQPHFRSFTAVVSLPSEIGRLRELAYNLWWSWHPSVLELFAHLDPKKWNESDNNPVRMLESVSPERLMEVAASEGYRNLYGRIISEFDGYMKAKMTGNPELPAELRWSSPIAYFSPEFGLHESIQVYSGGLGVLAGDLLKAASDMNIPLVGVGLLYRNGYFRQKIDKDGWQIAEYEEGDFSSMPVQIVRDEKGHDVQIAVELPGRTLFANIWEVRVGRVNLYLLDSDVARNTVQDRRITSRLYNDEPRARVEQEILLGIGGVKLLKKLGMKPSAYHINEGHSAFLIFERINDLMIDEGLSFEEAKEVVRSNTCFTTHTPVDAGNERFSKDIIEYYFSNFVKRWGINWSQFWELKRRESADESPFSMTVLGLKMSAMSNAVSRMHCEVAKRMWRDVWKGFHHTDVPIKSITNGVHLLSYVAPEMREVFDVYLGRGWEKRMSDGQLWKKVQDIPNSYLWRIRSTLKFNLVNFLREVISRQWMKYRESKLWREELVARINPAALTIGFARRFAPYKRAYLLLSDPDRLDRIVNNDKCPVQVVFAGKAHPSDKAGIDLIKKVIDFCNDRRFIGKLFFLEDYDLRMAKHLIRGVDLWVNTPRRPFEACGTSGQKVVINGGLNLSVSDGWWCEGFNGSNGWTVGPVMSRFMGYEDSADADARDAESLYSSLEDVIAPMFYERDASGVPQDWMSMVKESIMTLVPRFNAERMTRQYLEEMYIPAAKRGYDMTQDSFKLAKELSDWKMKVPLRFSSLRLVDVSFEGIHGDSIPVGEPFTVKVRVDPGKMERDEILVELVIGKVEKQDFLREPANVPLECSGAEDGMLIYSCRHSVQESGSYSYGVRAIPYKKDLMNKQELCLVLWG
ncbi:MAG TPA: alpha-glucan family phosphorylase [Syntrophales bacterium]|nr:alpha-glucan family phosphorylase [Syntrophales bacterium]